MWGLISIIIKSIIGNQDNNEAFTEPLIYGTIEIALLKPGRLTMRSRWVWVLVFFDLFTIFSY